jgi:SAM-dependent methyltransferase
MPTPVDIVGLDYNRAMLEKAQARKLSENHVNVSFVRGDATNMVAEGGVPKEMSDGLRQFPEGYFGFVSQVFGIGGIERPDRVFNGVIRLLEEGGRYFLTDMHRPIAGLPGEYFFFGWRQMPDIEVQTYEETTIPLALRRLWGWRDTTLDFYLLPLTTHQSEDGRWWGFSVLSLDVQSEHWWLGLPVMPVAKTLVEKVQITEGEARKRTSIRVWLDSAVTSSS